MYSTKGGGSLFPGETATWLEICIRVYQLPETLRVHTHNISFFKVPYHKTVKQKKWLSALGRMQWVDGLCLLLSTDIGSTRRSESRTWQWRIPTEGTGSVFQGSGSQITGGGSESWGGGAEIRRDPPNLSPGNGPPMSVVLTFLSCLLAVHCDNNIMFCTGCRRWTNSDFVYR